MSQSSPTKVFYFNYWKWNKHFRIFQLNTFSYFCTHTHTFAHFLIHNKNLSISFQILTSKHSCVKATDDFYYVKLESHGICPTPATHSTGRPSNTWPPTSRGEHWYENLQVDSKIGIVHKWRQSLKGWDLVTTMGGESKIVWCFYRPTTWIFANSNLLFSDILDFFVDPDVYMFMISLMLQL